MSKSKNPDGKKSGSKGGKNNKASSVETQGKPAKVHGPKPDYTPRPKAAIESASSNPSIVWKGLSGVVGAKGMRILSYEKKTTSGHDCHAVSVLSAPFGTPLAGMEKSDVYLNVAQIRSPVFRSNFKEGTEKYLLQKRMWDFFDVFFKNLGLKGNRPEKVVAVLRPRRSSLKVETSDSKDDLVSGVPGMYSFEKMGEPQAYFQVKTMEYTNRKTPEKKTAVIVEAVSVSPGHELYDYVRTISSKQKPFIFHDQLSRSGAPNFKGEYAGDAEKMWEFLTDLIAAHRKNVFGGETGFVSLDGEVVEGGAEVIYLDDRRAA